VAFLETADFSSHVWTLNTGSAYGADAVSRDPHALRLESNNGGGANASVLFQTAFSPKVWHNFAVQIDFEHRYALLRRGGVERLGFWLIGGIVFWRRGTPLAKAR